MVATLIMFTAGRGIAQLITDGQITYVRVDSYRVLGASFPGFPVPTPFIVAVLVVALTSLLLKKTALGMYIQSVGINKRASQLVGIKSVLIIFLTYAYCGLCSGLAGLIASSRIYSADANNIGLNMELDAILAVAIGGNSLGGGKFSLAGSVIGAFTIQALTTTLYAMHVSSDQVPVYKAIVVVIIVALQSPGFARWRKSLLQKKEIKAERRQHDMKGKMKLKQNSFLLLVTILLFFIMYGIGCVLFNAQGFSKTQNFLNLFISNAGLIVIGIGMTVVMITGGIDISVGSFVAMGCMMLAWMMEKGGIGAVPAVIIVLVTGIVFGLVQGFLVAYMDIQPFIVTLAGMFFCQRYDCHHFQRYDQYYQ